MRRLLSDVTSFDRPYSVVLVYDVSRWGRFQDIDASAYYEYHCRLNGVDVRYVQEPFELMNSPVGAMFKSLKRTMAAEHSRELTVKTTAGQTAAVSRGFQLGTSPCMGISRIAVSKTDGAERKLGPFDHKAARSEHLRWEQGPANEVANAQRIFDLYASTELSVVDVARVACSEGIRARSGKPVTEWMLYRMLRCEAFVGDFVWGREENKKRRAPTDIRIRRSSGFMPPIVSRAVFDAVQRKLVSREHLRLDKEVALENLRTALTRNPRLMPSALRASGCACRDTYRKLFGSLEAAWNAAGFNPHVLDEQDYALISDHAAVGARMCKTIFTLLRRAGIDCGYYRRPDRSSQTLVVNKHVVLRLQVIWRRPRRGGTQWWLPKIYKGRFDWAFVIRMNEDGSVFDSILIDRTDYFALDRWLTDVLFGSWKIHRTLEEVSEVFGRLTSR
ncbi:MAG: hypothetical protein K0Q43_5190 [Ramlibacter sp.]|nr:hypothetical protein [Ramlibacter sp.]MDF2466955.1 hypothetical protein [Ramlibacter sp.]